jgi:endonuclease/exonuclease/phosphatase family metal-dependent hydrolase
MQSIADKLLPNYTKLYSEKYLADKEFFNQVMYVKNDIVIESNGELLRDGQKQGLATYIQTTIHGEHWYICNMHGHPKPVDKLDTTDRISQSQQLIDFFAGLPGQKIIGGDFNLDPTTQSVKVFSQAGYKDLISDFGITSTRNEVAWASYPDNKQHFADYVFVSPGVQVKNFEVPYNEVSDHLPQILEVESGFDI